MEQLVLTNLRNSVSHVTDLSADIHFPDLGRDDEKINVGQPRSNFRSNLRKRVNDHPCGCGLLNGSDLTKSCVVSLDC